MPRDRDQRVLVAAPEGAQKTLRRLFAGCEADFFDDYDLAAASLRRRNYAVAIVGLQFAESRMFDFVREARAADPTLRIVCIVGTRSHLKEASRRSLRTALQSLGVEGLLDFTRSQLDPADAGLIEEIVAQCRLKKAWP